MTFFVDLTEEGELEAYDAYCHPARHVRLPIRDLDIPTIAEMRVIVRTVRDAVDAGEVVYVHCWGGVGRTGTVVGCLLREDGFDETAAADRLRELRKQTERAHRASPETAAQRRFVAQWGWAGESGDVLTGRVRA